MAKINYTKYILPTEVENYGVANNYDDRFKTIDYIYLESPEEIEEKHDFNHFYRSSPSDFCIANGAIQSTLMDDPTGKCAGQWWLRTPYSSHMSEIYNGYGHILGADVCDKTTMCCPTMQLDVSVVEEQRKLLGDLFKVCAVKDNKGKTMYHTITFGEFPQTYAGKFLNRQLEIMYRTGQLRSTGKKYTSRMDAGKVKYVEEYEFNGKRYVRVKNNQTCKSEFKDGTPVKNGKFIWHRPRA